MKTAVSFEPGSRVRVENSPLRGTVRHAHEEFIVVEFDSGEEGWIVPERLVALSPLEEIARLARKPRDAGKLKARSKRNPPSGPLKKGQHVRHLALGWVAIVRSCDAISCEVEWLDPPRRVNRLSLQHVTPLTPIEELALLGRGKKNPRTLYFRKGDRVRHTIQKGMFATVLEDARTWLVYVRYDQDSLPAFEYADRLEVVTPMEELAAVARHTAKKNSFANSPPPTVPDGYRKGERVRFRSGHAGRYRDRGMVGTVLRDEYADELWGNIVRVQFEGEGLHVYKAHPNKLERVNPREELAALGKAVKNPLPPRPIPFQIGERVTSSTYPGRAGTVTYAGNMGVRVRFDDEPTCEFYLLFDRVSCIGPMEELALVGKAAKSKKNPPVRYLPGDRVISSAGRVGVVASVYARHDNYTNYTTVWVRFDDAPERDLAMPMGSLAHIGPMEELALVGKAQRGKENPHRIQVGDRVRRIRGYGSKRGGTVTQGLEWHTNGNLDWAEVNVLFDGARYSTGVDVHDLEKLGPLEELALVGKAAKSKKNPKAMFSPGDRVISDSGRTGTVIETYGHYGDYDAVWVRFDDPPVQDLPMPTNILTHLSPMEELARVHQEATSSTPRSTRRRSRPS